MGLAMANKPIILKVVEGATTVRKYIDAAPYTMTEDGLTFTQTVRVGKDKEAEEFEELITVSSAFEILGRIRDPKGEGWARLLRWQDADGKEHTFAVSDADLHGDGKTLFGNLASRGLHIVTDKHRKHLIHYLNAVEVANRVTEVASTGWHSVKDRKIFALPDNVIGTVDGETIVVRGAADNNSPFEKRGTLDD
jgi:hypothetical protein